MQEADFNDLVDGVLAAIEDHIDEMDADVDPEMQGSTLNVTFPNGSSVVVSRQVATQEIWIAAKSGGFHLAQQDDEWRSSVTGESLNEVLSRVFTEQLGEPVELSVI